MPSSVRGDNNNKKGTLFITVQLTLVQGTLGTCCKAGTKHCLSSGFYGEHIPGVMCCWTSLTADPALALRCSPVYRDLSHSAFTSLSLFSFALFHFSLLSGRWEPHWLLSPATFLTKPPRYTPGRGAFLRALPQSLFFKDCPSNNNVLFSFTTFEVSLFSFSCFEYIIG